VAAGLSDQLNSATTAAIANDMRAEANRISTLLLLEA